MIQGDSGWLTGKAITPLYEHLAAFVPLEIRELQKCGGPQEWHFEEARKRMERMRGTTEDAAATIYPGHKKGLTTRAIATLVECLAVMAFVPGGVKFGPLHFWANRERDMKDMEEAQAEGPFSQFKLVRTTDVTGISGTGVIAVGVQWPDQSCHLFWPKTRTHGWYPSVGVLKSIHCYDVSGQPNAVVEWI